MKASFQFFGWGATLSAWERVFPVGSSDASAEIAEALVRRINEAVCAAAARNPLGADCKERGLCCWALARAAGLPAAVIIGVDLFPFAGHCWCEIGPWIVGDEPQNCHRFQPVLRFGEASSERCSAASGTGQSLASSSLLCCATT